MNHEVRSRILLEAVRLFGQRGYGSTSVRELVEAAGVTKPTLYYHFGNKEGLFVAAANEQLDAFDLITREALAGGDDLETQLRDLLLAHVTWAAEHPDHIRFLMTCLHQVDHGQPEIDLMSLDATLVVHLGAAFDRARSRGELVDDVDIPVAVINFLGILRGWALGAFHGAPIPPDFHRTVVRQYLHGIVPR
jgi:TetR/AcrR family transcriptional regulator